MVKMHHTWHLFFEVMNQQTRKGEIGLASSDNTVQWTYQGIVLSEPFHLSYPYIFKWMGDYYMVPESFQAHSIRLYKAVGFRTLVTSDNTPKRRRLFGPVDFSLS